MVEENLYLRGDGQRECLTCKRGRNRRGGLDAGIRDGVGRVARSGGPDNRAVGEGLPGRRGAGPGVGAKGDGANGKGNAADARDRGSDVAGGPKSFARCQSDSSGSKVAHGRVAQLEAHRTLNPQAVGSTPTAPTKAAIAQLEEQHCRNVQVSGSTPDGRSKICRSCEGDLIQVRGFWACPELTCSLVGQQQGRVS